MKLNGQRASVAIVIAALNEELGADPLNEELVNNIRKSLDEYVTIDGSHYVNIAAEMGMQKTEGAEVFSYAIPEWLLVLSFPMDTRKVVEILKD
jgi:hypothetical protein